MPIKGIPLERESGDSQYAFSIICQDTHQELETEMGQEVVGQCVLRKVAMVLVAHGVYKSSWVEQ